MNIFGMLKPHPTISEADLNRGLRMLTAEGVVSMAMFSVTTSGVLAAYALAIGANNFQIGIMASISFIMQPLQIPAILLVERFRRRKVIALMCWIPAQLIWIPMALIPVFLDVPSGAAISILLFLLGLRAAFGAVTNCAWNSWMRDFVPQNIMGRFYSRRLALATAASIVFGLGGAFFVQYWQDNSSAENTVFGYTFVLLFGAIFIGMASPLFMSQIPEPSMQPLIGKVPSLKQMLAKPFGDKNFRQLMNFLFLWGFAANLAVPFFTIYMLQRLEFPLTSVIALTTLSQITNIMFLRVWGPLADRYGSKVVLYGGVSLYLLVILGWAFTTMPEKYFLTVPLVIVLQIFVGIAAAGVNLTIGTIGLKLAPQGEATPYMASASLAMNLGAGLGPILGGIFIDFFSGRQLTLTFGWVSPESNFDFTAINFTGFDFLFAISFLLGLLTLSTLSTIREEGEAGREVLLQELISPARGMSRTVSSVPGLSVLAEYPYAYVRRVPGMDIAVGVTAYQLASSAKAAVSVATQGRETVENIAEHVSEAVSNVARPTLEIGEFGADFALHATRGAVNAVNDVTNDVGELARGAVMGALRALKGTSVKPADAIRGAIYGAVEGAKESGGDVTQATTQAIEGAREIAEELDLSPEEAEELARESALEAAEAVSPESVSQLEQALSERLRRSGED